ncbi:MAG: RelA/SpoT family protein [Salinivirgaceae bacterium]
MMNKANNATPDELKATLLKAIHKQLSKSEIEEVKNAIAFAERYYTDQHRKSGEPYISHPLRVATIALNELGLARNAVISSILHDLYDFKPFNDADVQKQFGNKVLEIIRGLHKISGLYTHNITLQNQNYIDLILNIVTDVRIILLKLADRLQNIRDISSFATEKQQSLAEEIGALYAPIAHRLGLYNVKTEMEEFWLKQTKPGAYRNILRNIEKSSSALDAYIDVFTAPIKKELDAMGLTYSIKGRVKSVYSIWRKMEQQNVSFDEVYDFFAVRIILHDLPKEKEKAECWNVYSVVSNLYRPNPKRLRDWISAPKTTGYESLHTTVKGPEDRYVEVQIRTQRMDDDAERGQAAHWKYKEKGANTRHDEWLVKVREILESPDKSDEDVFEENQPREFSPNVFVFTPGGEIKKLQRGATIIDFAYSIHSKVGDQCTGARINGKIVPIRHKLSNGDTVEIITSKKQKPNESWLSIAVSSRVKNRIKRTLREHRYKEAEIGKEELQRKLRSLNLQENEDYIIKLLKHFKMSSAVDLYVAFAHDTIDFNTIRSVCLGQPEEHETTPEEIIARTGSPKQKSDDYLLIGDDSNISQVNYTLANCCSPVFGDKVFGFVSVSKGIVVHRTSCPNAAELKEKYPYRIIKVLWNDASREKQFMTDVRVVGIDRKGVLNQISKVFSDEMNINMEAMNITAHDGIYIAMITFSVRDNEHLSYILQQLQQNKMVLRAERIDSN